MQEYLSNRDNGQFLLLQRNSDGVAQAEDVVGGGTRDGERSDAAGDAGMDGQRPGNLQKRGHLP